MSSIIANHSKSKYVFLIKFFITRTTISGIYATVQTYTTKIITITARPTIIHYSAYNLLVSDNFYSLDSPKLRTRNLS